MARVEDKLRQRVIVLKRQGYTYNEINKAVGQAIPKSTLSYICRGVAVSSVGQKRLAKKLQNNIEAARKAAVIANRDKLGERFRRHSATAQRIVRRPGVSTLKIALAMLYWGEGSKWQSYRGLSMGSSDIVMIQTYIGLLERCYGLRRADMKCRLILRADQNARALEDAWGEALGIINSNFYKTYVDKRTIGKTTAKIDYKGVCVVSCAGADIQLELAALWSEIANCVNAPYNGVDFTT